MKRGAVLLLSAVLVLSSRGFAQQARARAHLDRGLAHAQSGDTALALVEIESAIGADPKLADAHYHLGRLYTARASAVESEFRDRLKAEAALLEAIRLNSDDARYVFELGRLRLKQHMKSDASRLLGRSLDMARESGDPAMVAEIHFSLGYLNDTRYEQLRHRRRRPMFGGPPSSQLRDMLDVRIARYTDQFVGPETEIEDMGSVERDEMIEHYRSALRHDPGHLGAATRLMGFLLDELRLSEYYEVARKLVASRPSEPRSHLFLGLGLHAMGRESETGGAFATAFSLMREDERAAIENLATILRRQEAESYAELGAGARAGYEADYWRLRDPLLVTEPNERWLEHVARVAYADLRFTEPASGARGWETDRGAVLIRYGFPETIGSFSAQMGGDIYQQGKRQVIWSFGEDGPVFTFEETPGYIHARFAGDYRLIAENYRQILPAKYDNIPSITAMFTVPVQIARFRGETPAEIAVEIHAALPIDSLAAGLDLAKGEIEEGMFILNRAGNRIIERRETRTLSYASGPEINEIRSWRVLTPESGVLVAAVEARDPLTWRAATARDTFTAVAFDGDTLAVSDILIAERLRPLVKEPQIRSQLDIVPSPSRTFNSGDRIHMYYELYGLAADDEEIASYDVALSVRVKKLERGGGVAQLLGGIADAWGFSIVGDDRLELRFHREVRTGGRDRVIEYLTLDPNEVPAGEYEIRLRVWDRLGERLVSRVRSFFVD